MRCQVALLRTVWLQETFWSCKAKFCIDSLYSGKNFCRCIIITEKTSDIWLVWYKSPSSQCHEFASLTLIILPTFLYGEKKLKGNCAFLLSKCVSPGKGKEYPYGISVTLYQGQKLLCSIRQLAEFSLQ